MKLSVNSSSSIMFVLTTSSLLILISTAGSAIKAQQHQQLQPVISNTLAAKILNKTTAHSDQQQPAYNRDIIVNNHLNSMNANQHHHQQNGPPRDMMQQQQQQQQQLHPKLITGGDYLRSANQFMLEQRQALLTKSIQFDQHFKSLLSTSKQGLHKMFTDTYGIMYQENTEVFTEMYGNLEQYYLTGQVNLTKSMDDFFANLYKRVFQVYNSNKQFTKEYLDCVSDSLTHMKPFGDVPEKLIKQIRDTFVAARTFYRSLNEGIDVIKNVISLGPSPQCTPVISEKLAKNPIGPKGTIQKPCLPYCEAVIGNCLIKDNFGDVQLHWANYMYGLSELAVKLSTSNNIENIIEPLDVQISEAIMNFQENAHNITQRVYTICGGPIYESSKMARFPPRQQSSAAAQFKVASNNRVAKRSANPLDYGRRGSLARTRVTGLESLASEVSNRAAGLEQNLSKQFDQKSSSLIDEIKKFSLSNRLFFGSIHTRICTNVIGNISTANPDCHWEAISLDHLIPDTKYTSEVQKQAEHLKLVRSKIDEALAGVEVDWSSNKLSTFPITQKPYQRLTTMTTTTVAPPPPEPATDDEEEEYDPVEEGSGCEPASCHEGEPDCCEQGNDQDPDFEKDLGETPSDYEETSSSPAPVDYEQQLSTTTMATDSSIDDNHIDKNHDSDLVLITALNQPGFQKSGQTSCKLVINFGGHILLSCIMPIALLFVTNFSTRTRTISILTSIR